MALQLGWIWDCAWPSELDTNLELRMEIDWGAEWGVTYGPEWGLASPNLEFGIDWGIEYSAEYAVEWGIDFGMEWTVELKKPAIIPQLTHTTTRGSESKLGLTEKARYAGNGPAPVLLARRGSVKGSSTKG